ncbi:LEM domain-containing protein 1 [Otolemur garnettii]|uniref:LEM domain-containing protein 1 n=1 Tax=Otolemur garnettii TaxID=30611 RepID=UPI0006443F27|nr:LEM domain-containing protein 1 [Otolemur garnettii]
MVDVACLNDCELQSQLRKLGYSPGPILPSTRKLYEKKLVQLLVSPSSSAKKRPSKLDGPQDSDDSEGVGVEEGGSVDSALGISQKHLVFIKMLLHRLIHNSLYVPGSSQDFRAF